MLKAEEFIRRFLLHVLPEGFHRIRYYGFLANGRCKAKVAQIRKLLSCNDELNHDLDEKVIEDHAGLIYAVCEKGRLIPLMQKQRGQVFILDIYPPMSYENPNHLQPVGQANFN